MIGNTDPELDCLVAETAKSKETAALAVKVAVLLLGDKTPDKTIEKQARIFFELGQDALEKTIEMFKDTERLYSAEQASEEFDREFVAGKKYITKNGSVVECQSGSGRFKVIKGGHNNSSMCGCKDLKAPCYGTDSKGVYYYGGSDDTTDGRDVHGMDVTLRLAECKQGRR
jgi:hypothetical protein